VQNRDHNHCLGNKEMYPVPWPIGIRLVYKTLCEGNPARDILIEEICQTNEAKRKAVLTKTAAQAMQLKDPKVTSPHQMFPTV
jgi:hypothetical protein